MLACTFLLLELPGDLEGILGLRGVCEEHPAGFRGLGSLWLGH